MNTTQNHRRHLAAPLYGVLAIIAWAGATAVQAVPLEPDEVVTTESGPAASHAAIAFDSLGSDPTQLRPLDIAGQGDQQLIADYHELLFQIGLATGLRPPLSLADLPAALEAAVGLTISPAGAIVVTGPAYEDFRNHDPNVFDESPTTEVDAIVSDADVSAGGADIAAGELATTGGGAGLPIEWTSSANSLDAVAVARTGLSAASPGDLVYSPQGNAAGSSAGAAEPSTLALLLATVTAIVITVQAVRQTLKESDS